MLAVPRSISLPHAAITERHIGRLLTVDYSEPNNLIPQRVQGTVNSVDLGSIELKDYRRDSGQTGLWDPPISGSVTIQRIVITGNVKLHSS